MIKEQETHLTLHEYDDDDNDDDDDVDDDKDKESSYCNFKIIDNMELFHQNKMPVNPYTAQNTQYKY